MTRSLSRSVLCAASLLCVSALTVRADEVKAAPSLSTGPTISLVATSSKADVAAFLKTPVSFTVKGASFLSALDAVMTASGKTCPIECRQMKPMKFTFGAKGDQAGSMLDTLAKAGGGSLYIFPDKLLLSSPSLLSKAEKVSSKPYSVLLSKATWPQGKALDKQPGGIDMLALASKKISGSVIDANVADVLGAAVSMTYTGGVHVEYRCSPQRVLSGVRTEHLSLSFQDVPFGEALGTIAHMDGCELYLLPGKFLICPANGITALTPEEQKAAIPAFQYPGFGSSSPSAPNS
jgi:hypothetical protein